MLSAVIMAGGKGTRFWPLSREKTPKQLLALLGGETMLQAAVSRLEGFIPPERVIVVCGASGEEQTRAQLPRLPPENLVAEPEGRNTAACVALAAMMVKARDPEAVMAVFPADHAIARPAELVRAIQALAELIARRPELLGTIGIAPSYPETGYGYIQRGERIGEGLYAVRAFLEKPPLETAARYAASGEHYWNAGMFFWRADAILDAIRRHLPELLHAMAPIEQAIGTERFGKVMREVYPTLPSISIDYAVMEKAGAEGIVAVAAADPGWSDVGSWRALYDLVEAGGDGNRVVDGKLVAVDSPGLLIHARGKTVAVVGAKNLVVVATDDAVLVMDRDRAQEARQVTEKLRELGLRELL